MSFRFRKRIKIAPGVHINLSGSGISFNLGVPGLNVNVGKRPGLNLGLPGTGVSYRHSLKNSSNHNRRNPSNSGEELNETPYLAEDNIMSLSPEQIDSGSLQVMNHLYEEIVNNAATLDVERLAAIKENEKWKKIGLISKIFLLGFIPPLKRAINSKIADSQQTVAEIIEDTNNNFLNLDYLIDKQFQDKFNSVVSAFQGLQMCDSIWDVNSENSIDRVSRRSIAGTAIKRTRTKLELTGIPYVSSNYLPLKFCNTNGADIYLYPSFAVFYDYLRKKFAAVSYAELQTTFMRINFCEKEGIPADAVQVGETWEKVNKDGSRDLRFKDNYQIPIVQYGQLGFEHKAGIKEIFYFSNAEAASRFYAEFSDYQRSVECVE